MNPHLSAIRTGASRSMNGNAASITVFP